MKWMEYVRVIGENINACCILFGNLEERKQLGCPQHTKGGQIIQRNIVWLCVLDSTDSQLGPGADFFEHCNGFSVYVGNILTSRATVIFWSTLVLKFVITINFTGKLAQVITTSGLVVWMHLFRISIGKPITLSGSNHTFLQQFQAMLGERLIGHDNFF